MNILLRQGKQAEEDLILFDQVEQKGPKGTKRETQFPSAQ
jgi:hypothetical protein